MTIRVSPLCLITFVAFALLKLTGLISWGWLVVTSPLWILPALVIGFVAAVLVLAVFVMLAALVVMCISALFE